MCWALQKPIAARKALSVGQLYGFSNSDLTEVDIMMCDLETVSLRAPVVLAVELDARPVSGAAVAAVAVPIAVANAVPLLGLVYEARPNTTRSSIVFSSKPIGLADLDVLLFDGALG